LHLFTLLKPTVMKLQFFLAAALFCAVFFTTTGCSDDFAHETVALSDDSSLITSRAANNPVRRAYKDNFDTWYMIVPDEANGWIPSYGPFLTWVPGGGEGNATHMGNASTYFNQYIPFTPPDINSVPAPVNMFFNDELTAAGFPGIPSTVQTITYDSDGNSVWFWGDGNNTSTPVSPTRIEFTGIANIVGGTGKFEGATGQVTLNGYFNPLDPQDAGVGYEGWIEY
jgi:hypothetical protein